MTSRSKLSKIVAAAAFALLLGGTAHAASPAADGMNQGGSLATAAWQWLLSVLGPGVATSPTATPNDPKAGCEMDPNGIHHSPGDPSTTGNSGSVHL